MSLGIGHVQLLPCNDPAARTRVATGSLCCPPLFGGRRISARSAQAVGAVQRIFRPRLQAAKAGGFANAPRRPARALRGVCPGQRRRCCWLWLWS